MKKIKKFLKKSIIFLINEHLSKLIRFVKHKFYFQDDVYTLVKKKSIQESAEYVYHYISSNSALLFSFRTSLWDFALKKVGKGLFIELGVYKGDSIRYFSDKINTDIYGFDSFEGLKEDWIGTSNVQGTFNRFGKLPNVPANCYLIKGLIQETLPSFFAIHNQNIAFIHFDLDTYESTKIALLLCKERIQKGTILIFDEYLGYPNYKNGEFKAWQDFVKTNNINYTYIGFSTQQACIQIL